MGKETLSGRMAFIETIRITKAGTFCINHEKTNVEPKELYNENKNTINSCTSLF